MSITIELSNGTLEIEDYDFEAGCPGTMEYPPDPCEIAINLASFTSHETGDKHRLSEAELESLLDDSTAYEAISCALEEDDMDRKYSEMMENQNPDD